MIKLFISVLLAMSAPAGAAGYYAELGHTRVKRVVVGPDANGEAFILALLRGGPWRQTFIDNSQRGHYAGPDYWYDLSSNVFRFPMSVSMLGDSITANLLAVQPSLAGPWPQMQNLGVSGNTVAQVQARIASVAAGADHIVIEAGTNDLVGLGDGSNIIPGYTSMLNSLAAARQVIIAGIPPVDEAQLDITHPGWKAFLNNALIASWNAQLVTLCAGYANCSPALDLMQMSMVGKTSDGIHPLPAAYAEFTSRLLNGF